jgi:hypothetical protein
MGHQTASETDMKKSYPFVTVRKFNDSHENGSPVYAIWYNHGPRSGYIRGFISKTRQKTWQIDVETRYYGQRIHEVRLFSAAKEMAKELLA